jgi:hypothetical protein
MLTVRSEIGPYRYPAFSALNEFKAGPGSPTDFFLRGHGHIYRPKERSPGHGAQFSEVSQGKR